MGWQPEQPDRDADPLERLLAEAQWPEPSPETIRRLRGRWKSLLAARAQRRRRVLAALAAAGILAAAALGLWLQSDRGAGRAPPTNIATPSAPRPVRPVTAQSNASPIAKRPAAKPPAAAPASRPPNAYERVMFAAYRRTRRAVQGRAQPGSAEAGARRQDPLDDAIEGLVAQPDRSVREAAEPLLADRQWSEAALASRLGWLSGPQQVAAIRLLAEIATRRSLPLLTRFAAATEVHVEVVRAMARLSDSATLGRLARAEQDPDLRQELLAMLLARNDPQSVRIFLERAADPATSAAALDCLESVSRPPVEILFQCLHGSEVGPRMAAARVLGRLNQAAVSRELIAMILHGVHRQEAMIALLSSSETTAQRFLAGAAQDPTLSATFWNAKRQFQHLFPGRS